YRYQHPVGRPQPSAPQPSAPPLPTASTSISGSKSTPAISSALSSKSIESKSSPAPNPQTSKKQQRKAERRQSDLSELKRCLQSAIRNSLGHVHDQIIGSLPTEMSLYYQKVHDSLTVREDEPST